MTSEYVKLNDNIMAIPLFITSSVKRCGGMEFHTVRQICYGCLVVMQFNSMFMFND
ncbi:hypothetical protein HanHA300_Chr03g0082641 [Helianthus annuus]|nr:hypothetical protein HanHA300_Chr03g0082641 [Helianthus annuus]KAJ0773133.1 hypothetical protein HanOQP8_Chr03g0095461 [Helianthus annuus]